MVMHRNLNLNAEICVFYLHLSLWFSYFTASHVKLSFIPTINLLYQEDFSLLNRVNKWSEDESVWFHPLFTTLLCSPQTYKKVHIPSINSSVSTLFLIGKIINGLPIAASQEVITIKSHLSKLLIQQKEVI